MPQKTTRRSKVGRKKIECLKHLNWLQPLDWQSLSTNQSAGESTKQLQPSNKKENRAIEKFTRTSEAREIGFPSAESLDQDY